VTDYPFHPIAGMFPLLEGGEFAAVVDDILAHGLLESIVLFEGMILDGRNRDRACREAGVEPRYREMTFDSHADAVNYVISANIHRRHLTAEQKRELIEKLLKANPEQSDRAIADTIKADNKTVAAVRRKAEAPEEIPHVAKRKDRKGRKQPAHKEKSATSKNIVEFPCKTSSVAGPEAEISAAPEFKSVPPIEPAVTSSPSAPAATTLASARIAFQQCVAMLQTLAATRQPKNFEDLIHRHNLHQLIDFLRKVADRKGDAAFQTLREQRTRIAELEAEKHKLETERIGVVTEINELRARILELEADKHKLDTDVGHARTEPSTSSMLAPPGELDSNGLANESEFRIAELEQKDGASESPDKPADTLVPKAVIVTAPPADTLDIPSWLDRTNDKYRELIAQIPADLSIPNFLRRFPKTDGVS
jgi:hypothetical protein